MTALKSAEPLPDDAVDRVMRTRRARAEAEGTRLTAATAELRAEHRRQRAGIITPEADRRLREREAAFPPLTGIPPAEDERARRRAAERAAAESLGVDLGALARLQADTRERLTSLLRPAPVDGSVSTLTGSDAAPAAEALSWHGSWDAGTWWSSSAPSRTSWWADVSHFDPASSRSGSHLRFRHSHADSDDDIFAMHTSGFLLNYTMPFTGRLEMIFNATRAFGGCHVDCDNEPGWSDCWVQAQEYAVAEVYWDWSDPDPDASVGHLMLTGAMTDDTEAWIDTWGVLPGSVRGAQLRTDQVFPQGHTVLIYLATRQSILVWVDDVSVTVGLEGAWHLSPFSVRAI